MIEASRVGSVVVFRMVHGKANALDVEFCRALAERCEEFRRSTDATLVLAGQGSIFSAGVDLVLRAGVRETLCRDGAALEARVVGAWTRTETFDALRSFVERTFKKPRTQ